MSDKPLTPQVIAEIPFPSNVSSEVPIVTASGGVPQSLSQQSPSSIPGQTFPQPIIAAHTISDSIDTQSKRIKGTYQFDVMGALQIGTYQNGISGQINISPNGITAINKNNQTTFTIDGDTGDATFLGTVQAGSFVAGDSSVIVDGSPEGGRIVIFTAGVPTIVMGNV